MPRDGVGESEPGEARRRGRVEHVAGERDGGRRDERGPDERERVPALAVDPANRERRGAEVEAHVGEAEQCRKIGDAVRPLLHRPLAEDVKCAFERDDVGGVIARDREIRVAGAANHFVRRVERREHPDLDDGPVSARK